MPTVKFSTMSSFLRSSRQKIKLVIFDFDGVLADSFSQLYSLNRDALAFVGIKFSRAEYRGLFSGNIHDGLKTYIGSKPKLARYRSFRRSKIDDFYSTVVLFADAVKTVVNLEKQYRLAIVSSTGKNFIENKLTSAGLRKYFIRIYGDNTDSKESNLISLLKKAGCSALDAVMVTDTAGDVKTAKKIGLRTIGVTWGYQPANLLKSAKPDRIVRNFQELEENINDDREGRSFKNKAEAYR